MDKRLAHLTAALSAAALLNACSGSPPPAQPAPTASAAPTPASTATAASAETTAAPDATTAPAAGGAPADGGNTSYVSHVDETKVAQDLGADHAKLLQIAKLSPKTQKSLVRGYLWKALAECKGAKLVDVQPIPGVLVAKPTKVRAEVAESLKTAGALAKQRGLSVEVVGGAQSIKDAVKDWNAVMLDKTLAVIKAAPAAEQKEKSFAAEARKALGSEGPKGWGANPCDAGRIGGWSVQVQLITLDASGARGQVLVKAGPDSERFGKDNFESIYWDKKKGKNYRTLTEIMSAGKFVRQCSDPTVFLTSPTIDGSWRCREETESWDPPNRPIPAWQ
jgi:hypothetical protein